MARGFRVATESVQGRRQQNQDSVMAERFPEEGLLLAVADGMGGHAAGEVASALALETLLKAIRSGEPLEAAVRLANWQVHRKAQDPGKYGMGTTLTVLLLEDDRFHLANVGDSRAYRLSRRGIRQITQDHSFVAEAVKRGQSEKEAMASPWKDALTRSIGGEEEVEVDLYGPFPVEEDTAILLCSDGLYKSVGAGDIRSIFLKARDPREATRALVEAAYENGSDDNITVAAVEFGEFPRRRPRSGPPSFPEASGEERRGSFHPRREGTGGEEPGTPSAGRPENGPATGGKLAPDAPRPGVTPEAPRAAEDPIPPAPTGGAPAPRTPEVVNAGARVEIRRQAVGPWNLTSGQNPRIVGGPRPKKRSWMGLILVAAVGVIAAVAGFLYFR